jgi:hypothetical protein
VLTGGERASDGLDLLQRVEHERVRVTLAAPVGVLAAVSSTWPPGSA